MAIPILLAIVVFFSITSARAGEVILYPDTNAAPGWEAFVNGPSNTFYTNRGLNGGRFISRHVRGPLGSSYTSELVMTDPDAAFNGIAGLLSISAFPAAGCIYAAGTVGVSAELVMTRWSDGPAEIQASLRVRKLQRGGYIADAFLRRCLGDECTIIAEQGFPGIIAGPHPDIRWDGARGFVYSIGGETINFQYSIGPWNRPLKKPGRIVVEHSLPIACAPHRPPRSLGRVNVSKVFVIQ